jgi:ABC-2 type transport system permease protein
MGVDRASYRAWEGHARPSRGVAFAIAGAMIRRLMRLKLVRILSFSIPGGACLLAGGLFLLWQQGTGDPFIQEVLAEEGLDSSQLLPIMNRFFQAGVGFFAILLAALTGAPLIAEDRRTGSLPLYFSRPITHFDYVAGKMLTIGWFLSLLLILPPVLLYLIELGFAAESGVAARQFPVLLRSLVPSVALVVVLSSMSLGVSALTKKSNHAVLLFFGLCIGVGIASEILVREVFDNQALYAVSPFKSVRRIALELMPIPRRLDTEARVLGEMPVAAAWTGLVLWTAAGLSLLALRIRRVEVVT